MKRIFISTVTLMALLAISLRAAEPVDMAKRAEELKNLRWGMFVCWSFSTFSGKEWTPGVKDASFFKATGCDTEQWARTAREAGMGYILFLTKHHDGFCLWDTKTTDRKVTKSPLGRDVLAEVKKSCEKHGIKLALYFSEGDWTWPGAADGKGWQSGVGKNPQMKQAQLKELLTQYGPIEYLWFDHAVGDGGLSHAETLAFCKALQPGCFVGFNHGDQEGADIRLGEMGRPGALDDHAAAGPHMKNAPSKSYRLAEFTYPILPPHQGGAMWFYSLPIHDALCHPAEKLYGDYLGAVKFGNVFALDVGPDYAGRLREIDAQTLRQVGEMIRTHAPQADLGKRPVAPRGPSPDDQYKKLTSDSEEQPGVLKGKLDKFTWDKSRVFPGTKREVTVYVPAQYDGSKPAAVFVCQDGVLYKAPTVFDNLIARKELPVIIGVFIQPGDFPLQPGEKPRKRPDGSPAPRANRSQEYDTLSDDYARFLLEEILPEVGRKYQLTKDPAGRCIAGSSSGGICALTVCWQRPDEFRKCFTTVGSFTNIRGGDKYPELVRSAPKKPIRIFQQDGANDLVNQFGSWPEANRALAKALDEKGYDHKFVFGEGVHSGNHGTQIFPEVMRWMWRDYPK